jgi:hypothetical protein
MVAARLRRTFVNLVGAETESLRVRAEWNQLVDLEQHYDQFTDPRIAMGSRNCSSPRDDRWCRPCYWRWKLTWSPGIKCHQIPISHFRNNINS